MDSIHTTEEKLAINTQIVEPQIVTHFKMECSVGVLIRANCEDSFQLFIVFL